MEMQMTLIADVLLVAAALAATLYCYVLSRRLTRFTNLENGVGGAVAVLSVQVDEMTKALGTAQKTARGSADSLEKLTERAETAASRIELILASMHDLPDEAPAPQSETASRRVRRSRRTSPVEFEQ